MEFSTFGLCCDQMLCVAACVRAGGNVCVGLEDNLMLDRGALATNGQLFERAAEIAMRTGARVVGPDKVWAGLNLVKRAPEGV